MDRILQLIRTIHRRSLWQVLAVYVAASWVVLQVVDVLVSSFALPGWFPPFAIGLLVVGLPIVLATAFVQESSDPARRDDGVLVDAGGRALDAGGRPGGTGSGEGGLRRLLTWRNALLGGTAAFALWGIVAAAWIVVGSGDIPGDVSRTESPAVAVLPFRNLGEDPDVEPFVNGLHEDVLTQLSMIGSLRVISRTSVLEYAETPKNIREIGEELGVHAVLEGGVQRAGGRVRLNAQLIDAGTDDHLWAERFDERYTTENVFEIQSEIARRIASALKAELTPREASRISSRPTDDEEAYDFYLRGVDYRERGYADEDLEAAEEMFRRATGLDPGFAVAWAALSEVRSMRYHLGHDRSVERIERAKAAVDSALALAPSSPRARRALGLYHYRRDQDYERALEELRRARRGLPNDAGLWVDLGGTHRRLGRWNEALADFRTAAELDPRSPTVAMELGITYYVTRRYDEARRHVDRAVSLAPDSPNLVSWLWEIVGATTVSVDSMRAVIEGRPRSGAFRGSWFQQYLYAGETEAALAIAERFGREAEESQFGIWPGSYLRALSLRVAGREQEARSRFDSARAALQARLEETPDDPRTHAILGMTHAFLDERDEAVEHGERAAELLPVSRDALEGPSFVGHLARILAVAGETDRALDVLERVRSMPGRFGHPHQLRFEPAWDGLQDHPRFRGIVQGAGS